MTEIIAVNPAEPEPAIIERAAGFIRQGQMVAFPTETVYGLGANALDSAAVARVFEAKGRPATNPLIVHIPDAYSARELAAGWPDCAQQLAERFWPGPLTLVLKKSERVPFNVTGGGDTVALRAPAHPVAQALLRAAAVPIAAPSANRSTGISPTRAGHVVKSLDGRIPLILDGGATPGGMESTVLDLTDPTAPRILRPGPIGAELEAILPLVSSDRLRSTRAARSPGMQPRHYAPRARLELAPGDAAERARGLLADGKRVGWMTAYPDAGLRHPDLCVVEMPSFEAGFAARLYDALHELDDAGVDLILVTLPPGSKGWTAIRDRLARASAPVSDGS